MLVVVSVANVIVFSLERWVAVPLHVPSASMEPALRIGDRILVRRRFDSPAQLAKRLDRGDVVVFRSPERGHPLVVKRVIALPGETIQARNGLVAIDNSTILDEKWLSDSERESGSPAADSVDIDRTEVGSREVYVLGDNRDHSIDSRVYGPISLADVVGTEAIRIWPTGRFGTVDFQ
ncbi:MAG: signal peptidase [Thermoleophilia bacterium]|nr:signal peptidase [Thermoleophilia bacterium]